MDLSDQQEEWGIHTVQEVQIACRKQSECKLKKLRINGIDEQTSREFAKFWNNEGLEPGVIAPYTPQHNGIAEKKNRSILNMERCILKAKEIPR